ncbi:MAG: phosphopantetheine-binding protein [Ruminococcus flavefaciens]|nr:phosphopantetheine-binding protein [Ruminococcus flavefaciens]
MDSIINSFSVVADGNDVLISRNGTAYTYGMLYETALNICERIKEYDSENIAVCCGDYINEITAVISAGMCGKKAVVLDSRNGHAFNQRIMKELNCTAVVSDGNYIPVCETVQVKTGDIPSGSSYCGEVSLTVPEYLFPYISADGKICTACYKHLQIQDFSKFFSNSLKLDFSSVYGDFSEKSVFSSLAWVIVGANGGMLCMDCCSDGQTLCIVPLAKAYELSDNVSANVCFLTYGQGCREAEVNFSETADDRNIRWYNVFGYPYCSYITKIRKSAGRYFHIGKPIKKVHTFVLNSNKEPLQFGFIGNIYDTREDSYAETAVLEKTTLYRTLYKGNFIGERSILFKELTDSYENVCGDYINTRFISETMKTISGVSECITRQVKDTLYAVCLTEENVDFDKAYSVFDTQLPYQYKKTVFMFEYNGAFSENSLKLAGSNILSGIRNITAENIGKDSRLTVIGNNEIVITSKSDTDISQVQNVLKEYFASNNTGDISVKFCDENGAETGCFEFSGEKTELTEQEKAILEIWRTVLDKPNLSEDDNLYSVGGNSLDLMKIIYRISKYIGKDILISAFESIETPRESFEILNIAGSDDYSDKLYLERINDNINDIVSAYKYTSENSSENTVILSRDVKLAYSFAEKILQRGVQKAVCIADYVSGDFHPDNADITVIDLSRESGTIIGESEKYTDMGRNTGIVVCFAGAYEKCSDRAESYSMDVMRVKEAIKFSLYENKKSLFIIDDNVNFGDEADGNESVYIKSRRVISALNTKALQAGIGSKIIRTGIIAGNNVLVNVLKVCAESGCLPSETELRADISDIDLLIDDIFKGNDKTAVFSACVSDLERVFEELNIQAESMPYELWYIMADQLASENNIQLPKVWREIPLFKDVAKYMELYSTTSDKNEICVDSLTKLIVSAQAVS